MSLRIQIALCEQTHATRSPSAKPADVPYLIHLAGERVVLRGAAHPHVFFSADLGRWGMPYVR